MFSPSESRALELARANPTMSFAQVARDVGEPYNRVYRWLTAGGVKRERDEARRAREAERLAAADDDRARLAELLGRYGAGELTPTISAAEAAVAVHDVLNVQPAVARLREGMPSQSGEPLTAAELDALDNLADCEKLRG